LGRKIPDTGQFVRIRNLNSVCNNVEFVENSTSVSQSFTLDKIDKVKHYIKIKTHNT